MMIKSGETASAVVEAAGLSVRNGSIRIDLPAVVISKVPWPKKVILVDIVCVL